MVNRIPTREDIRAALEAGAESGKYEPVKSRKIQVYEWPTHKGRLRQDLTAIALGWCTMAAIGAAVAIFWPSATTSTMGALIMVSAVVVTWQVYRVIKRT